MPQPYLDPRLNAMGLPWGGYNIPVGPYPSFVGGYAAPAPSVPVTPTPTSAPVAPSVQPQMTTNFGRVVNAMEDIMPNEVPMDGSITLFPKSDFSCIYGKTWTKEGELKAVSFAREPDTDAKEVKETPVLDEETITNLIQNAIQNQVTDLLEQRFTSLEDVLKSAPKPDLSQKEITDRFDKLEKMIQNQNKTAAKGKEK